MAVGFGQSISKQLFGDKYKLKKDEIDNQISSLGKKFNINDERFIKLINHLAAAFKNENIFDFTGDSKNCSKQYRITYNGIEKYLNSISNNSEKVTDKEIQAIYKLCKSDRNIIEKIIDRLSNKINYSKRLEKK